MSVVVAVCMIVERVNDAIYTEYYRMLLSLQALKYYFEKYKVK